MKENCGRNLDDPNTIAFRKCVCCFVLMMLLGTKIVGARGTSCDALQCEDECVSNPWTRRAECRCLEGRQLSEDGRNCESGPFLKRSLVQSSKLSKDSSNACKFILTEKQGVIKTPNYPGRFQMPISCEWIIVAPKGFQTVIYFNEIYLRKPGTVQISSYDLYKDGTGKNQTMYPPYDFDNFPDYVALTQPFTVVRTSISSADSATSFVRVRQYLLDIFGFNLTYIMYPAGPVPSRTTCDPFTCSFAGKCKTTANYQSFYCECFEDHFGDFCKSGPKCNMSAEPSVNPCLNQGKCEYYFGTDRVHCRCPFGFSGPICEQNKVVDEKCKKLECNHSCVKTPSGSRHCTCRPGFSLSKNGRDCIDFGLRRLVLDLQFELSVRREPLSATTIFSRLRDLIPDTDGCTVGLTTENSLTIGCGLVDNSTERLLSRQLENLMKSHKPFPGTISRSLRQYSISGYWDLCIVSLSVYSQLPSLEKSELAVICEAEASPFVKFSWEKDGVYFDPVVMRDMWLTEITAKKEGRVSLQLNIENLKRVHQGIYTCIVEDFGKKTNQSLYVEVLRTPELEIFPASPMVRKGDYAAITCTTLQHVDSFRWLRKGEDVSSLPDAHHTVPIQPSRGSQLTVDNLLETTEYSCVAINKAGSREQTVRIQVLNHGELTCFPQKYRDVRWTETPLASVNEQPCPSGRTGMARRRCGEYGKWAEPLFFDCASVSLLKLKTAIESVQAGFGHRDYVTYAKLMQRMEEFVKNESRIRGRDMDNAIEMLEVLRNLYKGVARVSSPLDLLMDEKWKHTVRTILDHSDTKSTALNILTRFPSVEMSKELPSENSGWFYASTGPVACSRAPRSFRTANWTSLDEREVSECRVGPTSPVQVPEWINADVSILLREVDRLRLLLFAQTRFELSPVNVDASEMVEERLFPETVQLILPPFTANDSSIIANLTFYGFSAFEHYGWRRSWTKSFDSAVIFDMSCVQKQPDQAWSAQDCNTTIARSEDQDLITHVWCLCRLSADNSYFTLRLTNSSAAPVGTIVSTSSHQEFIVPVIVGIAALLIIILIVVWFLQRKKVVSCMTAVKKRTSNFVRAHFGTPESSTEQVDIPMFTNNRNLSSSPNAAALSENTALMEKGTLPLSI